MKITYLGDIMCFRGRGGESENPHALGGLKGLLHSSDYVVGNLETPVARAIDAAKHQTGRYRFVVPPDFARIVRETGVTHVSVANNHCLDQGFEGLLETLRCVKEAGLTPVGARERPGEPAYAVLEKGGIRVGLAASTYGTNAMENKVRLSRTQARHLNLTQNQELSSPLVRRLFERRSKWYYRWKKLTNREAEDWFDRKEFSWGKRRALAVEMREARRKVDFLVAYPHVGGQHRLKPMQSVRRAYDWFFRHGADAVIGNHEHCVQPAEFMKGRMAAFCLGNTLSALGVDARAGDECMENLSIALHQYLEREACGPLSVHYTFSVVKTYKDRNGAYHTRPMHELIAEAADDGARRALINELNIIGRRFLGREWAAAEPAAAEQAIDT